MRPTAVLGVPLVELGSGELLAEVYRLQTARNAALMRSVAARLPLPRAATRNGAPDKHEPVTPGRATGSTTLDSGGSSGGCSTHGNGP